MRDISSARASGSANAELGIARWILVAAVFGSAMAIVLLGEEPRLFHLVGYALVLAGVVIASRQGSSA